MALNTVTSKTNITAGNNAILYTCAHDKSHGKVDIDIVNASTFSTVRVALSIKPIASLTPDDYIVPLLELDSSDKQVSLTGIIVGKDEHIYVFVDIGEVNIRLAGTEEANAFVGKAGQLASGVVSATNTDTQIYTTNVVNAVSSSGSILIYNPTANNADIELYISTAATPSINDKTLSVTVRPGELISVNKVLINANETVFIRSTIVGVVFYFNGLVIL